MRAGEFSAVIRRWWHDETGEWVTLLSVDGRDVTAHSYRERRRILEEMRANGQVVATSESYERKGCE